MAGRVNLGIKCGACKQYHDTIDEVRSCHFLKPRSNEPEKPTAKQLDFAHKLADSRELPPRHYLAEVEDVHASINGMNKREIGDFIGEMKERPQSASRLPTSRIYVEEGMYLMDGKVYKVQRAVHGSGHLYAKVFNSGIGKFQVSQGAITRLRAEHKMSREDAAKYGHLYGVCMVCGRTLTDEESIEAGIGPICANKEGVFA